MFYIKQQTVMLGFVFKKCSLLLPPPRGNTAARPANHYGASGEAFFVFVELCDICSIEMQFCNIKSLMRFGCRLRARLSPCDDLC